MASYYFAHVCYLYIATQISEIPIIMLPIRYILYMKYVYIIILCKSYLKFH